MYCIALYSHGVDYSRYHIMLMVVTTYKCMSTTMSYVDTENEETYKNVLVERITQNSAQLCVSFHIQSMLKVNSTAFLQKTFSMFALWSEEKFLWNSSETKWWHSYSFIRWTHVIKEPTISQWCHDLTWTRYGSVLPYHTSTYHVTLEKNINITINKKDHDQGQWH